MQECDLVGYCNKFNLNDFSEIDNARFYIKDLGILNYVVSKQPKWIRDALSCLA